MNSKDFITKEEATNNYKLVICDLFNKNSDIMQKISNGIRTASLGGETSYSIPFEYLREMPCKHVRLLIRFLIDLHYTVTDCDCVEARTDGPHIHHHIEYTVHW